jgi:hypothetical protein
MASAKTDPRPPLEESDRLVHPSSSEFSSYRRGGQPSGWRLLLFFLWLVVGLVGEVGLVLSLFGLFAQRAILRTVVALAGFPADMAAIPSSTSWWVSIGMSTLLLMIGLVGLAWEQRDARRARPNRAQISPGGRTGGEFSTEGESRAA